MTIKTQQLAHSLHQLEEIRERLTRWKDTVSEDSFRNQVDDTFELIQDCLNIIYSILSET